MGIMIDKKKLARKAAEENAKTKFGMPTDPEGQKKIMLDFFLHHKWPEPKPVFWRLYYDDSGKPIEYSMEEKPGYKYIDITPEEYQLCDYRVRVRDGKIVPHKHTPIERLYPNQIDGTPCHPHNVSIVVTTNQPHVTWALKNDED